MTINDGDLLYNGELTDAPPLTLAAYSNEWRGFLLGVVAVLNDVSMWADEASFPEISAQISDLLVRLMGDEMTGLAYPYTRLMLFATQFDWLLPGGVARDVVSAQIFGFYQYQLVPLLNGVVLQIYLYLPLGSYEFTIFCVTSSNQGIFRWGVDDVYPGVGGNIDLYSAASVYNVAKSFYVSIPQSGLHKINLKNFGKHASSSNYYFIITAVQVRGPEPA